MDATSPKRVYIIQAAGADCVMTNTVVSFRDGETKATRRNNVLKTTEVHEPFVSATYEGTNGLASARWSRSETNFLGRTVGESRPGFGGSTLVTSNLYDFAGRLVTMLAAGSDTPFTWNYLPGSDLKSSLMYPNGLTASWTYDANRQLLQVCNATPTNVISQYDYTYDAAGRRVKGLLKRKPAERRRVFLCLQRTAICLAAPETGKWVNSSKSL